MKFFKILYQILRASRPLHWVKNLSLFAALIFSENLFSRELFSKTLLSFFAFNFATSGVYILNDIKDSPLDKLHPLKKKRPIASGELNIIPAAIGAFLNILISLYIATSFNRFFLYSLIAYILIQIFYTLLLKNIIIVDILIIAAGFILRVYAGAFVIDAHLSVWFLLCVISLALFLASGKRRVELAFLPKRKTRISLLKYRKDLLNSYVTMFGGAAWISWSLFTFFESPSPSLPVWLTLAEISKTTSISKFLMITIPLVIFGIMRYQSLIFEDRAEAPEKILLTDKSLVITFLLWTFLVIWILYGGVTN